jgi:hypothetical protein
MPATIEHTVPQLWSASSCFRNASRRIRIRASLVLRVPFKNKGVQPAMVSPPDVPAIMGIIPDTDS